eukprot:Gb_39486 [translate_table: standard]
MIQRMMLAVLFALLVLCAGIGLVVLVYLWLAWYASIHGFRERNSYEKGTQDGLSKSDIQKLPIFVCRPEQQQGDAKDGLNANHLVLSDLECAVCLEQFQDGEKCRLIPTCKHCFHVQCADAWLSKRSICPICRTSASLVQKPREEGPKIISLGCQDPLGSQVSTGEPPGSALELSGSVNSDAGTVVDVRCIP